MGERKKKQWNDVYKKERRKAITKCLEERKQERNSNNEIMSERKEERKQILSLGKKQINNK